MVWSLLKQRKESVTYIVDKRAKEARRPFVYIQRCIAVEIYQKLFEFVCRNHLRMPWNLSRKPEHIEMRMRMRLDSQEDRPYSLISTNETRNFSCMIGEPSTRAWDSKTCPQP